MHGPAVVDVGAAVLVESMLRKQTTKLLLEVRKKVLDHKDDISKRTRAHQLCLDPF